MLLRKVWRPTTSSKPLKSIRMERRLFAENLELAGGFRERRDAHAKQLLVQGRRSYADRNFVEAARHLTDLARTLEKLPQQREPGLEACCQEAFVLAASSLFLNDPAYLTDPTTAPWSGEIERLLGSIPYPETMRRGEDSWTRRACLKVQQRASQAARSVASY